MTSFIFNDKVGKKPERAEKVEIAKKTKVLTPVAQMSRKF